MKLTSFSAGIALAITLLVPQVTTAGPVKPYQEIISIATDISQEAKALGRALRELQRQLAVVPDEIYRIRKNPKDLMVPILGTLARITASVEFVNGQVIYFRIAAAATGAEGLMFEASELEALLQAAPKGNEISEVVLRVIKAVGAGQVTEIVKRVAEAQKLLSQLETAASALRDAGPCIRREIQELN
jgi:hypothetical protein